MLQCCARTPSAHVHRENVKHICEAILLYRWTGCPGITVCRRSTCVGRGGRPQGLSEDPDPALGECSTSHKSALPAEDTADRLTGFGQFAHYDDCERDPDAKRGTVYLYTPRLSPFLTPSMGCELVSSVRPSGPACVFCRRSNNGRVQRRVSRNFKWSHMPARTRQPYRVILPIMTDVMCEVLELLAGLLPNAFFLWFITALLDAFWTVPLPPVGGRIFLRANRWGVLYVFFSGWPNWAPQRALLSGVPCFRSSLGARNHCIGAHPPRAGGHQLALALGHVKARRTIMSLFGKNNRVTSCCVELSPGERFLLCYGEPSSAWASSTSPLERRMGSFWYRECSVPSP